MPEKPAMAHVSHNSTKATKVSYPLPLPLVAPSASPCLGTLGTGTGSGDTGAGGDEGGVTRKACPAAGPCLSPGASLTASAASEKIAGTEQPQFTASFDPSESVET